MNPFLERVKEGAVRRRVAIVSLVMAGLTYGATASPIQYYYSNSTLNLTEVANLLRQVIDLVPDLIDLITGVVPLIVIVALVGFIVAFFDKILAMLKIG